MTNPANIYIIASKFNYIVTQRLHNSAVKAYKDHYNTKNLPQSIWVPGAVELPLMSSWVIEQKKPDAIVCLGAVVKGESAHFEYVCQQVSYGCQQVSLQYKKPVTFGVLTVDNLNQALQRTGGLAGDSGKHAMLSAITMLNAKIKLQE